MRARTICGAPGRQLPGHPAKIYREVTWVVMRCYRLLDTHCTVSLRPVEVVHNQPNPIPANGVLRFHIGPKPPV